MNTLREQMDAYERQVIATALRSNGGQMRAAARDLGVAERTLWARLKRLGATRAELISQNLQSNDKCAESGIV